MSLSHSPSIIRSGLVLYLDAANSRSYPGTGTTWTDLSTGGNNSILTNGPTYSSSNQGYITFNGSNNFSISNNSVSYGNNTTWEAWVNRTSSVNSYNMFMGRYLPYFGIRPGDFIFSNRIGNTQRTIYSTGITPVNNIWYHLVFTTSYDGTTNTTMSMYINGELNTSSAYLGTQDNYAFKFVIGDGSSSEATTVPWYPFNGNVSSVKVYNRALSLSEVKQNYNATKGRYGL